jgi:hypothetical protein
MFKDERGQIGDELKFTALFAKLRPDTQYFPPGHNIPFTRALIAES